MPKIQSFTVISALPERLKPLRSIAHNLWWTWNHDARALFNDLAAKVSWDNTSINPVELVNSLSTRELELIQNDDSFLKRLDSVCAQFKQYENSRNWWPNLVKDSTASGSVAYFSLEFALHESLTGYSGGLGVLAGDHLKASSDLGIPLVAVGLLYYEGYFSQYLNTDGWQQEAYIQINLNRLPIAPAENSRGEQVETKIRILGQDVLIRAWLVRVGNTPLYLLDTNFEENPPEFRSICSRLYGGDSHARIRQEMVLGIGGLRILEELGIQPAAFHMNEGHSACLSVEQMRQLKEKKGLNVEQAIQAIRKLNLFTTHTPVPAGNDAFPADLIGKYFSEYAEQLDISIEELINLGKIRTDAPDEPFSMPVLALRTASSANGVSLLHGRVSRNMWSEMWPKLEAQDTPISSITNGVHTSTWASHDSAKMFDRYIGPEWRDRVADHSIWEALDNVPDDEFWNLKAKARLKLVKFCRERVRMQLARRGAGRSEIASTDNLLNPEALTIGFARRFATYKRATLLLHDFERLCKIISDADRPVQFIFAGKAHPADHHGKEFIARLIHAEHHPNLKGKLIFIENYDVHVAAHMVQGVDVWLNNPRRPLEASGTSGMKVSLNAGLNFSVLDGWWCEAFDGRNGWSIGQGEEYEDAQYQDRVESNSLYDLMERELVPMFYERNDSDLPGEWIDMMRHAVKTVTPQFSAARMLQDYASRFYKPLLEARAEMEANNLENVKAEVEQVKRLEKGWKSVGIVKVETDEVDHVAIGEQVPVRVTVSLGEFSPADVAVELRLGELDVTKQLVSPEIRELRSCSKIDSNGTYEYVGTLPTCAAGTFGFETRVVPRISEKSQSNIPGLITWWQ